MEKEELEKKLEWYKKRYGPYIEKRGLNNWKNLFRKPTLYEWTILFMIIMALFIALAYNHDVSLCKETLNNMEGICLEYCSGFNINNTPINYPPINISLFENFIIKEESQNETS